MKKDYIITFLTEFMVLASGILVYKLAVNVLGKDGFSEYALSRRTISFIQPALLMGLGVGIPRYIAYASASVNPKNPDGYFVSGLSVVISIGLIFMLSANLLKGNFAFLMFGNSHYSYLILPISLVICGLLLHALCYSYFRGRLLMKKANILQMINIGIFPLFAFVLGKTTQQVLSITGIGTLTISFIFLFFIIKNIKWKNINILSCGKELLIYGLPRVPGDFGMAALLSLPAIFTAHITGLKEAGYVAFGISMMNMVGAVFAPVGLILLPKASQFIANKDFELLKHYVSKLIKTTIILTSIGLIFFEIFADKIIHLCLGSSFSDLVMDVRIIMIGSLAYAIYVIVRSVIDAYYKKAVNVMNIVLTLMLFLLLSGVVVLMGGKYIFIIGCFVIALYLLGGLTLWKTRKLLLQCRNCLF